MFVIFRCYLSDLSQNLNGSLTLQDWHCSPYVNRALAAKLTEGAFQEEKWNSTQNQHQEIGNEKGTCSKRQIGWYRNKTDTALTVVLSGLYITSNTNRLDTKYLPPPFLQAKYGNLQIFPSPTAQPIVERIYSSLLAQFPRSVFSSPLCGSCTLESLKTY